MRCAQREPRLRQARSTGLLHRQRDAEIGHHRVAGPQQDVLRLDVAVHNTQRVRRAEGIGDLAGNLYGIFKRQLPFALQTTAQRLARHVRHHVEQQSVGRAAVEQRQDVRVLQLGRGANLAQKAFDAERFTEVGVQHFDGDVALVLEIVREVDGGHTSGTELALDAIAVGKRRREARQHAHATNAKARGARASTVRGGRPAASRASTPARSAAVRSVSISLTALSPPTR